MTVDDDPIGRMSRRAQLRRLAQQSATDTPSSSELPQEEQVDESVDLTEAIRQIYDVVNRFRDIAVLVTVPTVPRATPVWVASQSGIVTITPAELPPGMGIGPALRPLSVPLAEVVRHDAEPEVVDAVTVPVRPTGHAGIDSSETPDTDDTDTTAAADGVDGPDAVDGPDSADDPHRLDDHHGATEQPAVAPWTDSELSAPARLAALLRANPPALFPERSL